MTTFHERISSAEAVDIWQAVHQQGFLTASTRSIIIHDLDRLQNRLEILKQVFPESTLHAIAIKANPVVEVLRFCVQCGCGLEAASIEEVELALAANCPPNRIVFDSPAKTTEEIQSCLARGVHLNANEFDELHRIARLLDQQECKSNIGLRINPEISSGKIGQTSVGISGSRFGVSLNSEFEQIVNAFGKFPWLNGLHVHVGSQGCSLDQLCESIGRINELRKSIESATGLTLNFLDIGGGLPAPYSVNDCPPPPQDYFSQLCSEQPDLLTLPLITEFGRSIHAGCGIAFTQIEYVTNHEASFQATVHLGADFLLRPVYRNQEWKHEFFLLDSQGRLKTGKDCQVTLGGPLCFGGDFIGHNIPMAKPEPGDWIAVRDCGAYTTSMWSRHCSRGIPAIVGIKKGLAKLLRQKEKPSDIVQYWSKGTTASTTVGVNSIAAINTLPIETTNSINRG